MSPVSSSLFSIYEYLALKALYGRRGGVIQQGKLMQIHAFSLCMTSCTTMEIDGY